MSHNGHFESAANSWRLICVKSCFRLRVDFITHSECLAVMGVVISSVSSQSQERQSKPTL